MRLCSGRLSANDRLEGQGNEGNVVVTSNGEVYRRHSWLRWSGTARDNEMEEAKSEVHAFIGSADIIRESMVSSTATSI